MSKKVVIIGDSGVGKTSILFRYVKGEFDTNINISFGAGFKTKDVAYNDQGDTVKLFLWDTAGQEKYNSLTKLYFKGASAAIVVYDITERTSFEKAKKWVDELYDYEESEGAKMRKFIAGNKCDIIDK